MKKFNIGEIDKKSFATVGGKARGLDRLVRSGFSVPAGFVLIDIDLHKDLDEAAKIYTASGLGRVAVRSSASIEDGADFSYAGQFETCLDIASAEQFKTAVKKCVDSLSAVTVENYNKKLSGKSHASMCVVVQKMVNAKTAGVCFTSAPDDAGKILVEAVEGLGEALVSGSAMAKQYKVGKLYIDQVSATQKPLNNIILKDICYGAVRMQELFHMPMDLEWAHDGLRLYWLQARPITVLENCTSGEFNPKYDMTGHAMTRCNIGEMLPGAVTPLTLSTTVLAIDWGMRRMLWVAGANCRMKKVPEYGGAFSSHMHLFINLSNIYRMTRTAYLAKKRDCDISLCGKVLDGDKSGVILGRNTWFLPKIINSIRYLNFIMSHKKAQRKLDKMTVKFQIRGESTGEIYKSLTKGQRQLNMSAYYHYITSAHSGAMSSAAATILDKELKGQGNSRAVHAALFEHIDGIESVDILAGLRRLAAAILATEPSAKGYSIEQLRDYLRGAFAEVQEAYTDFLARHGHRAIREAELRSRGWADDENAFLQYLKTVLSGNTTPPAYAPAPNIPELLKAAGIPDKKAKILTYLAKQARNGVKNREYSKSKMIKVFDTVKHGYVRLADMLVEQKRLPDADAIYFLTHKELGKLVGSESPNLVKKALQRRRLLNTQAELTFDECCIGMPQPKKIDAKNADDTLTGTAVSVGIATGHARVIKSAEDAAQLKKGEIMVAGFTDVGWTPYYCLIEGLVTEVGSALSHGGVVAREYALPFVTNISGATSIIKTGDLITIDGGAGVVRRK